MLDNMDIKTMTEAVKLINGKCETKLLEAFYGNSSTPLPRQESYISVGALTHSAENIDLSLNSNAVS
jgi:nicotinate-nucleotide pyrophosphorylase (carboxylating)